MIFNKKLSIVTIGIDQKHLHCGLIKSTSTEYIVHAFEQIPLEPSTVLGITLFNMTHIVHHIRSFLNRFVGKKAAYAVIAIPEHYMQEKLIHIKSTDSLFQKNDNLVWRYQLLYTYPTTQELVYYACALSREHIFQYQLLAQQAHLSCLALTVQWWAQWYYVQSLPENDEINIGFDNKNIKTMKEKIKKMSLNTMYQKYILNTVHCNNEDEITTAIGMFLIGKYIYEHT